jgi:hypothetical protein
MSSGIPAAPAAPTLGAGDASGAVGQMQAAFDYAINKAAEITAITTVKKAELDAAKQRPQN